MVVMAIALVCRSQKRTRVEEDQTCGETNAVVDVVDVVDGKVLAVAPGLVEECMSF